MAIEDLFRNKLDMKLLTMLIRCCWLVFFLPYVVPLTPRLAQTGSNMSRRNVFAAAVVSSNLVLLPLEASAETSTMTVNDLLTRIKSVPTFCIVNPDGAAYMVVNRNEGMAIGYAFTTFEGALAVLGDAQRNAEKKGYADLWKDATITVIPADIAIRLALKKTDRLSQKEQKLGTRLNIIPGADDREDALKLDKKFTDQGKVPLFYYQELELQDGTTPVYFKKKDLLSEWRKQYPEVAPPRLKLLDLVDAFQYVLRGRGDELPKNIVFIPSQDTVDVSNELKSRGLAPYKVDRMIV